MQRNFLRVWPYFVFITGLLAALQFWPASYWLTVKSVQVKNGKPSTDLEMVIDRNIKRSFNGESAIAVRKWEGEWVVVCIGKGGGGEYRAGARLPKKVTLGMWTELSLCHPMAPGLYTVSKTWTIQSLGLMPDKYVTQTSNQFEVLE